MTALLLDYTLRYVQWDTKSRCLGPKLVVRSFDPVTTDMHVTEMIYYCSNTLVSLQKAFCRWRYEGNQHEDQVNVQEINHLISVRGSEKMLSILYILIEEVRF